MCLWTLVAAGRSNEDIADQLVVSPHTVKTHVNRAMTKLDTHDRAQLVIAAYEARLVQPVVMSGPASQRSQGLRG